jgi:hypothetical protein
MRPCSTVHHTFRAQFEVVPVVTGTLSLSLLSTSSGTMLSGSHPSCFAVLKKTGVILAAVRHRSRCRG